jgi:divalent metal cation (Fe/Co/Zn/Cd) transporter
MTVEGAVGLVAGVQAGSIALVAWALGSAVEGLASVVVVWRFSGSRTLSESAELQARRGVAISFWILAPYVAPEAVRDLSGVHHPETTWLGMALTAVALLEMPLLGRTKQRLGARLGSAATKGEGRQNYMCAAQAAAVLAGLIGLRVELGSVHVRKGRVIDLSRLCSPPALAIVACPRSARVGQSRHVHGSRCFGLNEAARCISKTPKG